MLKAVTSEEVAAWKPLVESLAKRYEGWNNAEFDDLVQEGLIVVFLALQRGKYPGLKPIEWAMIRWVWPKSLLSDELAPYVHENDPPSGDYNKTQVLLEDYCELSSFKDTTRRGLRFVHMLVDLDVAIKHLSLTEKRVVTLCGKLNMTTRTAGEVLSSNKDTINRHYRRSIERLDAFLSGRETYAR